ncbi:hypothetical protein [Anaerovorax sp. IOR16]|uniref:hypothetical protein n=1 Tax=Anaerovorax sp. IOR16 TaxID=2773458 RepID=UPI0019D13F82|nr:hypothetical protein [Anaerovorax sp. IOR16]
MKKTYRKWWFHIIFLIIFLILPCAFMPQILSYFDHPGSWLSESSFHKDDLLNFYAAFFTFLGTVILGVAAIFLSQQANDMNKRLIKIEENNYIPTIDINCMSPDELKDFVLKDVFCINLDDTFVNISEDMDISTESSGMVVLLTMTNVSRTDIINIELCQLTIKIKRQGEKSIVLPYKTLTISLNNKVPYQSTIPFIIGGIPLKKALLKAYDTDKEIATKNSILSLTLEFHCTNFLGEIYVQRIKVDLVSVWDQKINFPAVENKRNIMIYSLS